MSSLFRKRILFHQVQCRAIINSALRFTRPIGEPKSTAHWFFQVKCRAQFDSPFRFTRSNGEPKSTAHCFLPDQMSSPNRQRIAFYQVKWWAQIESALLFTGSNVELKSTYYLQCFVIFFVGFWHLLNAFKNSNFRDLLWHWFGPDCWSSQ
jgi:hypothetical protein